MKINVFHHDTEAMYYVWLDDDIAEHNGVWLAAAKTRRTAMRRALKVLVRAERSLWKLIDRENKKTK